MQLSRRTSSAVLFPLLCVVGLGASPGAQPDDESERPSVSLRVTPPVGFTPLRVRVLVDVQGGDDDYADFYCPELEWEWGDGTMSANAEDCDPYVAGSSRIRRRYSTEHTFRQGGRFNIVFRMKQADEVVAQARASIQVRDGFR